MKTIVLNLDCTPPKHLTPYEQAAWERAFWSFYGMTALSTVSLKNTREVNDALRNYANLRWEDYIPKASVQPGQSGQPQHNLGISSDRTKAKWSWTTPETKVS